jgi:CRP-like cAMP-binding protein
MASLLTLTFSQPVRNLAPGEVLITEGDPGGELFVLESGKLTVLREGVAIASIDEPGALIGEMSVLLGTEATATVRADRPTAVRVVRDALAFLERQPLVTLRVATLLSARLDRTSQLLAELTRESGAKTGEQSMFNRLMKVLMEPGKG